jgi:hypothetical protein
MSKELDNQAVEILQKYDRGGYSIPTARLYPYPWNWDSAFVALGFQMFDRDRAWAELELLLEGQWDNGMIPSIIFRSNDPDYFPGPSAWQTQTVMDSPPAIPSTGISQPPVLASVILSLVESGGADDRACAEKMIDRVLKYHQWYQLERTSDYADVIGTVHPWETGRDNCPDWELGLNAMRIDPDLESYVRKDIEHANPDQRPSHEQYDKYLSIVKAGRELNWDQKALTNQGPFLMADPGIHFILLRANKDLLKLAKLFDLPEQISAIEKLVEHGNKSTDYFWNEDLGAFTARNILTGEYSNGFSNASGLCFYADAGTQEQRARTIENMTRVSNRVKYMMPSWDPDAASFDPQRYWCGPVWPQMNYIISTGLQEQGYVSLANDIRRDLGLLIQKSGFYECFNPVTGEGCIGTDFSWTAAIWLAWASPSRQKMAA